jgi:hypothetical protein
MANDIIDINVYETVETVTINVEPNLTTVNINQIAPGQGGNTNLGYTPSPTNGIVTSDTGTDATIPLANTTDAGLFSSAEKTKLAGIATGANVGVVPNAPIIGSTKTKITYDSKGLVTAGADATTADIADSINKRYVTDANLVVIGNTSGTNTGDQSINTLTNVVIDNLFNGDVLQYESASGLWKNKFFLINDPDFASSFNTYNATYLDTILTSLQGGIGAYATYTNETYIGTIVWTGGSAPSGATQHTYSLSRNRNLVTLTINLSYGTAGAATLTTVSCELPSTAPTPALPASVSAVGDILNYGTGMISVAKTLPTTTTPFCALRIKSTSPNVYEISVTRAAAAYRYAYITIQYFV